MYSEKVRERFWSKVERSDDPDACWEWQAGLGSEGYGQFKIGTIPRLAHRVSFELASGAVPHGLSVLHSCDNRRCVRPDHLRAGTQKDNIADMISRGRRASTRGENGGAAKLTESDVLSIRARHAGGESQSLLAREFGVKPCTVSLVISRKNWGHL